VSRRAWSAGCRFGLALAAGTLLLADPARAQTEFAQTLNWGSGLIDIPAAYVSPLSGDFSLNWSGRALQTSPNIPQYQSSLAATGAFQVSLFRHAELGMTVLSQDFEHGFYGQILLLNQDELRGRTGSFLPSVAIGLRNVGPYSHLDRFGLGYQEGLNPNGGTAPIIIADSLHRTFSTGNTVYGVATKSFSLADLRSSWPDVGVSLTLGYGNGLFSNHGTLPTRDYAADATGGLFYGIKTDYRLSPNTLVSVMAENNAWDFNAGTYVSYRGLRAGVAVTEIAAGSAKFIPGDPASALYRYTKLNFSIGWESNFFALLRGNLLQNRVAELRRQRDDLLAQIGQHQERIAMLQGEIHRYEAQNLLELEERRAQAQSQLQTETEALRRLEDRLRRIESETSGTTSAPIPATTTPPASTPQTPQNSERTP
jgi:uncharacterized small protein (DUF1192 family)